MHGQMDAGTEFLLDHAPFLQLMSRQVLANRLFYTSSSIRSTHHEPLKLPFVERSWEYLPLTLDTLATL